MKYNQYHKVGRCLARYSPRAEANNTCIHCIQYHATPYDTMQWHARLCNIIRCNAIPCSTQKNLIFGLFLGQKWALAAPQELAQQHERHKNVVFLVSGHDGNEEIGGCAQKIDFWPKNSVFGRGLDNKKCSSNLVHFHQTHTRFQPCQKQGFKKMI